MANNAVLAQSIISGSVKDASGKPIYNSSVTYTLRNSDNIMGFALSDSKGNYKLVIDKADTDSINLHVSFVGYASQVLLIKNKSSQQNFVLYISNELLPEVIARSNTDGIYRKKDTINYITDSFLSKQDRVLSDVIKKLPGIEMNGDQILYQGKPLRKFYVEGMGLMGGRYGVINNNLPVEDVKKVQIIENDQPIKVLDSLVPSNEASLNVVLKKFRTTGTGKLGIGGAPLLWDAAITPMSFFKNFQMVNTYQANNTGNTISNQLKYLTSESNPANAAVEKYVALRAAGRPPLGEERWLNNNINMFNSNVLFKTKKEVQWKAGATFINDFQKTESYNKTTIITPEADVLVIEAVKNLYNLNDLNGIFSVEKNDKNILLKNQLTIGKRWSGAFGQINKNNETNINQDQKDETFFVSNTFNATTKWGKQLVGINSSIAYAEMPQQLTVSPGQFIEILNDSIPYNQIKQEVFYKNFRTNNSIDFIKKVNFFVVNIKAGVAFQRQQLESNLQTEKNIVSPGVFGNNVTFLKPQVYFLPTFSFIKNKWQITLASHAAWQMFAANYNQIASDTTRMSCLITNPSLNIVYTISPKWELSGGIRHNNDFGSQTQLYTGYILSTYNNLERSAARRVSQGATQSASLYLKYENALKSRFANLSVSWSQSQNNYLYRTAYDTLGLLYSEMMQIDNNRSSIGTSASLSQYFRAIKTVAKFSGKYSNGKSDRLINNQFVKLYSGNYGFTTEITNSAFDWFSAEYIYRLTASNAHYSNKKVSTSIIQNHALGLHVFFLNNHSITANTNYYLSSLYNRTEQLLMNLKYTFTLPKSKTDFAISCNNLFNTKYFIAQYNTAYTLAYSELYLRPRQVLASVRFNFR
ncbi:carboxypeptidase-like regulatory domain-containing protein [Niabella hirudinis]|uniref:carboxypeptidase-like regulatory domain-containing protein n=1 Tax=Niabella hirudinis TaxID=1285929 RepID=UPI003EB7180C